MIHILVVGQYKDAVDKIAKLVPETEDGNISVIGTAITIQDALQKIEDDRVNVVVFTMSGGDSSLLDLAKKVYITKPQATLILYADSVNQELSQRASESGIRFTDTYPETKEQMESMILRLYQMDETRTRYLFNERKVSISGATVISFYGVKSGIGRTSIAINTAVDLAKNGKSVVLMDLDSEFGNVANYMDITSKKTIVEILQDFIEPSINDIESYMALHQSGVHVIPAPKSPEYAEIVSAEKVAMIVNILKKYYDYIILNMPAGLNDFHISTFKCASRIYFITDMTISGLKNSKNAISVLNMLQEKQKISIIVSRYSKYDIVSMKDIHNITGCRIIGTIPSDYKIMVNSTNTGIPLIISNRKHPISKSIHDIVLYTLSEDDTLDIWDMNQKKRELIYKEIQRKLDGDARRGTPAAKKSFFRR